MTIDHSDFSKNNLENPRKKPKKGIVERHEISIMWKKQPPSTFVLINDIDFVIRQWMGSYQAIVNI